jgi:predicted O-methyltransferase YrrM
MPFDPALEAALQASTDAGLPSIQISASQGRLLHLLALSQGARRILEVGTLGGFSTLWLARALPAAGHLLTLELEPRHAEVARGELDEALRIRREEQLPVYERLGDVRSRAVALGKIADVLQARGELDEALRLFRHEVLPVFARMQLGDERRWAERRIGEMEHALKSRAS